MKNTEHIPNTPQPGINQKNKISTEQRYHNDQHHRMIAEFISVHKITT